MFSRPWRVLLSPASGKRRRRIFSSASLCLSFCSSHCLGESLSFSVAFPSSFSLWSTGGLEADVSGEELESVFSKYGQVSTVWVARNPPGFAFLVSRASHATGLVFLSLCFLSLCVTSALLFLRHKAKLCLQFLRFLSRWCTYTECAIYTCIYICIFIYSRVSLPVLPSACWGVHTRVALQTFRGMFRLRCKRSVVLVGRWF